jgi:hypothetical protein
MQPTEKILTDSHEISSHKAGSKLPTAQSKTEQNGSAPRPDALQVLAENIPDDLKRCRQWVTWRFSWDGKTSHWTKVPTVSGSKAHASSTNKRSWDSFEACLTGHTNGTADGVGFVVCDQDKYTGIDLDGCINPTTDEIEPAALVIVEQLDSYTELSPSGTGLRIFIRAKLPRDEKGKARNRCAASWKRGEEKAEIEIYDTARYLTMTGHHWSRTPRTIESRQTQLNELHAQLFPAKPPRPKSEPSTGTPLSLTDNELLEKAFAAKNGAKMRALYGGGGGAYPTLSEADSALCWHLAFYTRDAAQIERIWLSSALMRDKAEREDYRQRTIDNALENVTETYTPKEEKFRHGEYRGAQALADSAAPNDGEEKRPHYETFTFADMAALPRPQWIIRSLLVENTTSVISADSGHFKSFIALEMALCVATGTPFHGREVRQGAAVYVAAEGFYTLHERAAAWAQQRGCELPTNFHILKVPVNVSEAATVQKFAETVAEFSPALVVLDTLSQCAVGLNENANNEMADFMRGMMALSHQIGAHVQAVHHNSKATGTFRGAGAIKANVDTHITLDRPDAENTVVFVRCEKQRGKPFEPFALAGAEIELPITDEFGDAITSLVFDVCGDAVTAKHPNTKKADKTGAALLEVFDKVATEAAALGFDGVKVGFWKEKVEETTDAKGDPICSEPTFWRHRKALEKSGAIVECGTHNGSPLFRRKSQESNGLSKLSQLSQLSNDSFDTTPKTVSRGVLSELSPPFRGDSSDSTDTIGHKNETTLPGMPPAAQPTPNNNKAQSEPYSATFGPSAETEAEAEAEATGPREYVL